MTQTDYTTVVLAPDQGHYLTQAADVPLAQRVVTDQPLYLASTDSPANWREITAQEAQAYLAARREAEMAAIPEKVRRRMAGQDSKDKDKEADAVATLLVVENENTGNDE